VDDGNRESASSGCYLRDSESLASFGFKFIYVFNSVDSMIHFSELANAGMA
jgi:hypothetical protein